MHALEIEDVIRLLRSEVEQAGGQSAFAKKVGMDRSTINRILNGQRSLHPKILRALNLRIVFVDK